MPRNLLQSQNSATKQIRKASSSSSSLPPHTSPLSTHTIKSTFHSSFDSSRKDAKRQAKLRCIKFFHVLELKLCKKEYRELKCLRSDKPCCRYLSLKLDKELLNTKGFKVRRHHVKEFRVTLNNKPLLSLHRRLWTMLSPKMTALHYASNDVNNFKQIISHKHAITYRKLTEISFPLVTSLENIHPKIIKFLINLRAIKTLFLCFIKRMSQEATLNLLQALNHLSHLKALSLNLKDPNEVYLDTLAQALQNAPKLRTLALKHPKINKNLQKYFINKVIDLTGCLNNITYLQLEIYPDQPESSLFKTFLSGLEKLTNLISLDLTIIRSNSKVDSTIELPDTGLFSILNNIKYLTLKGDRNGIGFEIVNYFLSKMTRLETCNFINIGLEKEETAQQLLKNGELRNLSITCGEKFESKPIEVLLSNIKKLQKLQDFELQINKEQTIEFNVEDIVKGLGDLKNANKIALEVCFVVTGNAAILNKLFENLSKLRKLTKLLLYLRLQEEVKSSVIKKIFMLNNMEEITIVVENMKLNKQTEAFIKTKAKVMKRLVGCSVKCTDFLINRSF